VWATIECGAKTTTVVTPPPNFESFDIRNAPDGSFVFARHWLQSLFDNKIAIDFFGILGSLEQDWDIFVGKSWQWVQHINGQQKRLTSTGSLEIVQIVFVTERFVVTNIVIKLEL
jgi:hypothetical protein